MSAPMRRPARPCAFENVRPTITLGNACSSGMKVAPAKSAYASSTKTIAPAGTRRRSSAMASIGIDTPVGLFGFVRKTTRVRGVIAASTSSSAKTKSGLGITAHRPGAGDRRVELEDLEGRLRDDRFGHASRRAAAGDTRRRSP